MDIKSVKLIYFSPTKTTKNVLKGIAEGIQCTKIDQVDLTSSQSPTQRFKEIHDEMTILGVPVYGGRIPVDAVARLEKIKPNNTPAVVVVLYGNRAYEDALLELADIAGEAGFTIVAGGAFIGEHSFSNEKTTIAKGRPDKTDLEQAKEFGKRVREKMKGANALDEIPPLKFPGNFPYKERSGLSRAAPVTKDLLCTLCGECVPDCPTGAITIEDAVMTDLDLCIKCSACVKTCSEGARVWEDQKLLAAAEWLSENCRKRKEPETFI